MYIASRGLYNLKPPTVFVPPCIKEDVEKLIDIHRTMGQVELNLELVALDVGMSNCLSSLIRFHRFIFQELNREVLLQGRHMSCVITLLSDHSEHNM